MCCVMTQHALAHTRTHVSALLNVNYIIICIKYIFHRIGLVALYFYSGVAKIKCHFEWVFFC